jgi:hypothetical protein
MANGASSASSPSSSSAAAGPSSSPPPGDGGDAPRQRRRPPRAGGSDPLLIVCGCFSVVTVATALLCVAVNVLSAAQAFRAGSDVSLLFIKAARPVGILRAW